MVYKCLIVNISQSVDNHSNLWHIVDLINYKRIVAVNDGDSSMGPRTSPSNGANADAK